MAQDLFEVTTNWYETTLPLAERRRLGHFSTPPTLVEHILDACAYTPDRDLSRVRVLDPACGGGNFLTGAARRLLTSATTANSTPGELAALAQRNLWGFDPDPVACFLAETRLQHVIRPFIPRIRRPRLHIHQSDTLAMPWQPCVDLFLANPPYLAAKNTDLSAYQSTRRGGQIDSYLLFLRLGLHIVRPDGWLGLVLPDPFLARANAAPERGALLRDFTIHHLWHFEGVFTAQVGAVVVIAQKRSFASTHHIAWIRRKWRVGARLIAPATHRAHTVPQALFLSQPRTELRYLLSDERGSLIERLRRALDETRADEHPRLAPLGEFVTVSRGEELGRESEAIRKGDEPPISGEEQAWHPVLLGGVDVRPYRSPVASAWIHHARIKKPLARYLTPKLLVVKSTDRLQAALDTRGQVALQTLYLLHQKTSVGAQFMAPSRGSPWGVGAMNCAPTESADDLYYFLALLNSRLLRDYVYMLHTAYKWVQPQIEQNVLAALPVPLACQEQRRDIIERSKQLARACSEAGAVVEWNEAIQHLYEEQEQAISLLYNATLK